MSNELLIKMKELYSLLGSEIRSRENEGIMAKNNAQNLSQDSERKKRSDEALSIPESPKLKCVECGTYKDLHERMGYDFK